MLLLCAPLSRSCLQTCGARSLLVLLSQVHCLGRLLLREVRLLPRRLHVPLQLRIALLHRPCL